MKKLLQTMKAFLVIAMLCVGTNVWADITVGADGNTTGYLEAHSPVVTMANGSKLHYVFTQSKATDGNNKGWHLWVGETGSEVTWANGIAIVRGDNWDDRWQPSSQTSGYGNNTGCNLSFNWDLGDAFFNSEMNGATFDMTITYINGTLMMATNITSSTNQAYTYSYLKAISGSPSTIDVCLAVNLAQLTISTSEYSEYYNVTRYSQDYEDATNWNAGWDNYGSQEDGNGGKVFYVGGLNSAKTCTLSFADNGYFKNATDYVFSFQFAFSNGNNNAGASSLVVKDTEGNALFTFSNDGNWDASSDITYGETTVTDVYASPYNNFGQAKYANIVIIANQTDGVILSISSDVENVYNNKSWKDVGVTKAIQPVRIADFARIGSIVLTTAKSATHSGIDNMSFKEHSDVAIAEDPTFTFKNVSGENRVYTITNPNGEGVLYYTTSTADAAPAVGDVAYSSTTESTVDVPFSTGTYYAYAVLADGTTTSAIVSQSVSGGAITLNTPTWTKTAYNAETSTSTVTLTSNQSGKLGNPTADIYYKINDGTATKYIEPISVIDGQKLSYYATATGYTTSTEGSVTATAPCFNPNLRPVETYYRSSDGGISVNTEETEAATIGSTKYRYMYCDAKHVSEYLVTSSSGLDNWMLRSGGLYCGKAAAYAIMGVQENDYITITFGSGTESPYPTSSDGTKDEWNSTPTSYTFKVTSTNGFFRFNFGRYGYIKTIKVQRAYDASATMKCMAKKYGTFAASFDVELPEGVIAYTASLNTAGNAITLTELEGTTIPAGTPVIIYSEDGLDLTSFEGYSATDVAICGDGVLKGALQSGQTIPGGSYVLQTQDGVQQFYKLTNSVKSNVNRCWIELPAEPTDPAAKASLAIAPDDITGVKSVSANAKNAPMKRIVNGQLIIEKDGKQYNAMGQEK